MDMPEVLFAPHIFYVINSDGSNEKLVWLKRITMLNKKIHTCSFPRTKGQIKAIDLPFTYAANRNRPY